ncbi:hypothetical protein KDA23_02715 [Candidatus Saccharibacteria bacterium]|nr:hypothetical protein [Candidatus Saccharibacteria bacterium]
MASSLCASFYGAADVQNAQNMYCFTAPTSTNTSTLMQGSQVMGATCDVQHYENSSALTMVTKTDNSTVSLCGFNQNGNSYCGLNQGDQIIMNFDKFQMGQKSALAAKCHGMSTIVNCTQYSIPNYTPSGSGVSGAWAKSGPWTTWKVRFLAAYSSQQMFANVANNVEAVQQSITAGFWSSNASTFGIFAALVSFLAIAF